MKKCINSNIGMTSQIKKYFCTQLSYVPKYNKLVENDLFALKHFIEKYNHILILTGAGISTESGIPDYRSEEVGLYAKTNRKPILYQQYIKSPFARQRYWARNFVGWPKFSSCLPNDVHYAITKLENQNKLSCVITQNVDNLHFKAGTKNVIELHGSSYRIICLGCNKNMTRHDFQKILIKLNPHMKEIASMVRPDGDVEIPEDHVDVFKVPHCEYCGGIFKPDVVFFGDNVPSARVNLVQETVVNSNLLLVLGSSLTVYSSYRIILQAKSLNIPIIIINIGPTKADNLTLLKVSTKCGDILPRICAELFR